MAAMSLTKNSIFNLSKAFPQFLSLSPCHKVSRVCFTSASKSSEGRNAAEEPRGGGYNRRHKADESVSDVGDRASEMTEKAKKTMKEGMDRTKERTQGMKDKAKEHAENMKEKTNDTAGKAADKAKEGTERAAGTAQYAKEKANEQAHNMKEKTKDAAGTVADKTTEGANKTAETVQALGEKAKQTMEGTWGAAKETTQKIKETVVGKSKESFEDDYIEDHVRRPAKEHGDKTMDDEKKH